MKKIFLISLILIVSISSKAQIEYIKGYYISNSGKKNECLIKNVGWKNNPTKFEYKVSEEGAVQTGDINEIKEFSINGVVKFIRAEVDIDRSSNATINLSSERNPIFNKETLFLKVLIEGDASLYNYEDGKYTRFFYSLKDSEITQLVYKRYLTDGIDIAENTYFRQQILLDLKCDVIETKNVQYIKYGQKDLVKIFVLYNQCVESEYLIYQEKQKKYSFNLNLRPGLNLINLNINRTDNEISVDMGSKQNYRFGIESELVLPFNNNKWAVIFEPTYQYYNSTQSTDDSSLSGGVRITNVEYQSIELPVGIRHYFFLNDKGKIFVDGAMIFDRSIDSKVEFTRDDKSLLYSLEAYPSNNFCFGLGYKYMDKISLEIQYKTSRDFLINYYNWKADYKTVSFVLGYTIF
ncbi:hypothetical protein [Carboxylicivirga caseinilyticus]|uniref:hypothetical protein n=1 Tax=Carboxylicivirga caseinilyticus TaxID=3417572 RepID=UPI003D339106|nr:hypothetical protein [Marinilabiliaceae bacterium A049]